MQLSCQKDWIIFLVLGWGKAAPGFRVLGSKVQSFGLRVTGCVLRITRIECNKLGLLKSSSKSKNLNL